MTNTIGYSAQTAARTMIDRANDKGIPITNLKIQKLLYFAHGLLLALSNRQLVDENFQAWKYGPVIESLYHDLKIFGSSAIPPSSEFVNYWDQINKDDSDAIEAIDAVLDQLGANTGGNLIEVSHDTNGPWHRVYHENTKSIDIDNSDIQTYFNTIVNKKAAS